MLVDHLSDRVSEQHHILIKRLDLPLKLDAVDQINGHGHVLFSKQVQKWVLKELTFVVHDILRVLVLKW